MEIEPPMAPPTGDLDTVLAGLRAAGEPTRLRILAALSEGELSVSELCRVLGQTQPRVSRHLRLLCDAGLLTRHSEGTNAYYAHPCAEPGRSMLATLLALISPDDHLVEGDRHRLTAIREERADAAERYFEQIAEHWHSVRSLHVDDVEVEGALLTAAERASGDRSSIGRLLDIGTGTGRILELFADRIDRGLGIDLSSSMLKVARANLGREGLAHCAVRQGNVYALEVPHQSFDLAIVHNVLHFLGDPGAAIAEAALAIRPGGQLIIVDFAPHGLDHLRREHAHLHLGFDDTEIVDWCRQAGLAEPSVEHLVPTGRGQGSGPDRDQDRSRDQDRDRDQDQGRDRGPRADELLTVGLWSAIRPTIDLRPPQTAFSPEAASPMRTSRS